MAFMHLVVEGDALTIINRVNVAKHDICPIGAYTADL
ncbi:hypothetical protein COLO4_16501 [Corchorus olitorius]|uniref:Uncharacterized protein n=1 Tax=Corchorus olitorius TaxID=93759 RepID=A0A1R3JH29_9ROSI|nr:hypothetical protein COLO4_16501 [Corchorus olitorius]